MEETLYVHACTNLQEVLDRIKSNNVSYIFCIHDLSPENIEAIVEALQYNTSVTRLYCDSNAENYRRSRAYCGSSKKAYNPFQAFHQLATILKVNSTLLEVSIPDCTWPQKDSTELLDALKDNKGLKSFKCPVEEPSVELIEACFAQNTTLEHCEEGQIHGQILLAWYARCNKVCNELGATIQERNSIPRDLQKESQIRSFVKALRSESEEWRAVKLVTLGHGGIGKTTLLNRLRAIINPFERVHTLEDPKSTIGIECKTTKIAGGEVSTWDFAGQLEYTSTHQFFLSIETVLYLLCFDMSEPIQKQQDMVEYWLQFLNSALPLPTGDYKYNEAAKWVIFVVGLKSDRKNETVIQQNHLNIWIDKFPRLPLLPEMFYTHARHSETGVKELLAAIKNEFTRIFSKYASLIPASYKVILQDLLSRSDKSATSENEVFAKNSRGLTREGFRVALQYLHSIGRIVYLSNGLVFPDSHIATQTAAKFISPEEVRKVLLPRQSIQIMDEKQVGYLLQCTDENLINEISLICELGLCYELKVTDNKSPLYLFPNLSESLPFLTFPTELQLNPNMLCAGIQFTVPRPDTIFVPGFCYNLMVTVMTTLNLYWRDIVQVSKTGMLLRCQGLFDGLLMMQIAPLNKSILFVMMASNPNLEYITTAFRQLVQRSYAQYIGALEDVLCPVCIKSSGLCDSNAVELQEIGIFAANEKMCSKFHSISLVFPCALRSDAELCRSHSMNNHDIFISYRVFSEGCKAPYSTEPDGGFSRLLYDRFAVHKNQLGFPLYVFLDKFCLNDGKNWEKGFLNGLLNSKIVVLLLSNKSLERIAQNAPKRQDNVLVEIECSLLRSKKQDIPVFPVFLSEIDTNNNFLDYNFGFQFPDEPHAREKFAQSKVDELSQGLPTEDTEFLGSIQQTMKKITLQQGIFLKKRGEDDMISELITKVKFILHQNATKNSAIQQEMKIHATKDTDVHTLLKNLEVTLHDKVEAALAKEKIADDDIPALTKNDWRSMDFVLGEIKKIERALGTKIE